MSLTRLTWVVVIFHPKVGMHCAIRYGIIWNHKPQIGGVLNGGSPMNVKVDDSVLLATMMPCWEAPSGPVQPIFHRKSLH